MENKTELDTLVITKFDRPACTLVDGIYEATYDGFKTYAEDTQWGHREGARLWFKVSKGPYAGQSACFKGNFFQENSTKKYIVGMKSKLAEVIRIITGGNETLNPGHVGTKVFINVKTTVSKKTGATWANVETIMGMPKYDEPTAKTTTAQAAAQTANKPAPTAGTKELTGLDDLSDF